MKKPITVAGHSTEAEMTGLAVSPLCPGQLEAEPPSHEHGWPQETVPYPIARAMEFCLENCQFAQCKEEPSDSLDSDQQKCKYPRHCSIVLRADKR